MIVEFIDKRKKGQAMTADFLLAIIIMIIVIAMASSSWNRSVYLLREKNESDAKNNENTDGNMKA